MFEFILRQLFLIPAPAVLGRRDGSIRALRKRRFRNKTRELPIFQIRVGDDDGDGDDGRIFPEHPSPILHAPRDIISRKGKSLTPIYIYMYISVGFLFKLMQTRGPGWRASCFKMSFWGVGVLFGIENIEGAWKKSELTWWNTQQNYFRKWFKGTGDHEFYWKKSFPGAQST